MSSLSSFRETILRLARELPEDAQLADHETFEPGDRGMTDITPTIRVRARPIVVHDADTYLLLLDLHGRGLTENGCTTEWVRLRDYSGRELDDTAPTDPENLGRLDGPTAQKAAQYMLNGAREILVELLGPDHPTHTVTGQSLERYLAWVWIDGLSLGNVLAQQHAVAGGGFVGGDH